jgi:Flp pilus assembly protein TadG
MRLTAMKIKSLDRLTGLRASWARLAPDTSGLAAVEFALIVPLMLVMFFGTIEISSGVAVDRKVTMVAQTLSDLTSRYTSVNDTDMTNFQAIGDAMMTPYSKTPLKATITQIYIDPSSGVARAQWSKGDTVRSVGSTVPVPAALIGKNSTGQIIANQYLIFSEVSYLYTPAVGYVMGIAGVTLTDQTYTRPRQSTCVFYSPDTACTTK